MLADGIIALLCAWGPFIPSANAEGLGKFEEWTAPVNPCAAGAWHGRVLVC
jgi:hypothetical protein